MLRPAVATTNSSRAGKACGLDIRKKRPCGLERNGYGYGMARPVPQSAQAGGGRQRQPENSVIDAHLAFFASKTGLALPRANPCRQRRYPRNFGRNSPIPDKTLPFPRISKATRTL